MAHVTVDSNRSRAPLEDRVGPALFRLGGTSLWAYVCFALIFGVRVGSISIGFVLAVAVFFFVVVLIARVPRWFSVKPLRLLNAGIFCLILFVGLIAADIVVGMRQNWISASASPEMIDYARRRDPYVWHGELLPRPYVPPGRDFALYKPNARMSAVTFGATYWPEMFKSQTLASILERRQISYAIGPEGLRETEPLSSSRIFALGDSFVFGYMTDEGKVWTDRLGTSLGEPVFNLGLSGTGPRPQLELVKYMLETYRGSMRMDTLLWMIYEGNDLESPYSAIPINAQPGRMTRVFQGTVLQPLLSLPVALRSGSVVRKLVDGEFTISRNTQSYGRYEIDGVTLPIPLFHSPRFGYRLFHPDFVEPVIKPREYVLNHPNRPIFDEAFREMRDLSQKHGFAVTVVIAPVHTRLYGPAFDGFPTLAEPHFIRYTEKLSQDMGFKVIDLLPLMRPFAETEMLHYRDDDHWNVRGNEIVAELIRSRLGS